jgi:hypothetical protein
MMRDQEGVWVRFSMALSIQEGARICPLLLPMRNLTAPIYLRAGVTQPGKKVLATIFDA